MGASEGARRPEDLGPMGHTEWVDGVRVEAAADTAYRIVRDWMGGRLPEAEEIKGVLSRSQAALAAAIERELVAAGAPEDLTEALRRAGFDEHGRPFRTGTGGPPEGLGLVQLPPLPDGRWVRARLGSSRSYGVLIERREGDTPEEAEALIRALVTGAAGRPGRRGGG